MKLICSTKPIIQKVHSITLYCPESKSFRMYPWIYECPVCGCKDSIVEGCKQCDVCRLKVRWIKVVNESENLGEQNYKALYDLKRKLAPPTNTTRRIIL
jgi:hypothetical protein